MYNGWTSIQVNKYIKQNKAKQNNTKENQTNEQTNEQSNEQTNKQHTKNIRNIYIYIYR